MKRTLFICAVLSIAAVAVPARAVDLPVREPVAITNTVKAVIVCPDFQGNGQLQRVQVVDDGRTSNTCLVSHVMGIPGSARKITNSVATLAYTATWGASLVITNGPYYVAGDSFTYAFATASTGLVFQTRTIAK